MDDQSGQDVMTALPTFCPTSLGSCSSDRDVLNLDIGCTAHAKAHSWSCQREERVSACSHCHLEIHQSCRVPRYQSCPWI